jgi:hypothetical protein
MTEVNVDDLDVADDDEDFEEEDEEPFTPQPRLGDTVVVQGTVGADGNAKRRRSRPPRPELSRSRSLRLLR